VQIVGEEERMRSAEEGKEEGVFFLCLWCEASTLTGDYLKLTWKAVPTVWLREDKQHTSVSSNFIFPCGSTFSDTYKPQDRNRRQPAQG